MSNRTIFRSAVIGILVFELAIGAALYLFDDGSLDSAWELLPGTIDWFNYLDGIFGIVIIVLLIFVIIASLVGVLLFRNWGRWLYLWSAILTYPLSVFTGPTIYYGWESALWDIANMANGAIMLSMFLPPINHEFMRLN